jgi:hypothetical protein
VSVYGAWAFDEGSGSTIIDYSGNSRNMTVSGSNSWIAGEGAYANAFQAGSSGSDGAVFNAGSAIAALAGDVTLQLWYQHTTTSNTTSHAGGLYSAAGTARAAAYSWRNRPAGVISSSPHITGRDSAATIFDVGVNGTTTDASWHNVAFVYHATGSMDLYLDGTLLSPAISPAISNPIGSNVIEIGVGSVLSTAAAQAAVQDMRVFTTALTGTDVVTWMNTPVHPASAAPPRFAAYGPRTSSRAAEAYRFGR